MKSRWNDNEAKDFSNDPLALRVYTSRLIGGDPNLVLHGGGNTSVKHRITNLFGESEDVLFVKGSGWDLKTIEAQGFAPVRMDTLLKMAELESLSDSDMVSQQRAAMLNPDAPNPSIEAILHAILPFNHVDHTHADAVVTITNTLKSELKIKEIYGDRVLIIPYVMPGFVLAKEIQKQIIGVDLQSIDGLILMNHGVFTFSDDARESYERMIDIVDAAEQYLADKGAWSIQSTTNQIPLLDLLQLASLRQEVSTVSGQNMIAKLDDSPPSVAFSNLQNLNTIATKGPLTPDHVIRTKRTPFLIGTDASDSLKRFCSKYQSYFSQFKHAEHICLDQAPRWAVWPQQGTISFGKSIQDANIIEDISHHTMTAIQRAEALGGWYTLPPQDIFDVEYWELEQVKLKGNKSTPALQGKAAIVTGAASGIGRACVEHLIALGAAVVATDISKELNKVFNNESIACLTGDITDDDTINQVINLAVRSYGGIDILISNAGNFPSSQSLEDIESDSWQKSIDLNLTSHQKMLKASIPFLKIGLTPAVVIVGSKNVSAPGPGAATYSTAKAALNQLARIAAMELAKDGIRVNSVHPNAVFDTGLWDEEVLSSRAKHYGLTVEEYKSNNLLKVNITSKDVARLVCTLCGPVFSKTTGAQVPIDGGNERVI